MNDNYDELIAQSKYILICATNREQESFHKIYRKHNPEKRRYNHPSKTIASNFLYYPIKTPNGTIREHVCLINTYPSIGSIGTHSSISILCQRLSPDAKFILFGTAFGVKRGLQNEGDILISSYITPYDRRKASQSANGYQYCYKEASPIAANSDLLKKFREYAITINFNHQVIVGNILSGNVRVQSSNFLDDLLSKAPHQDTIIGGEMEGAGLLSLQPTADEAPWLVIKGISDFADESLSDTSDQTTLNRNRDIAAINSAAFVWGALNYLPPT